MTPEPAAALATAAAHVDWSAQDEAGRAHVQDVFVDTLAVMAAGADRPLHRRMRASALHGDSGPSTVLGAPGGHSTVSAIALNATLPTVLQLDEGYRLSRGHPGIHIVPVVLAIGEQRDSSLSEVLTALLAGYEVSARVGTAMGGTRREIHPHGNWGTVGAAVAAARLLAGADVDAIRRAIEIAAGIAGQHDRRAAAQGAGMHHLWASTGAHSGYLAGLAAASGASAVDGALVDHLLARCGAAPAPEMLVDGVVDGAFSELLIRRNYFKLWAACGHTHTAIGAALEAADPEGIEPDEIADVEVRTFAAAAALDATSAPNDLAARFSIPFVVAAALVDGTYTDDSVADAEIERLAPVARRVRVTHDPAMDGGYPASGRPLQLTVHRADGTSRAAEALLSAGDAERPASRTELHDKARRLFARAFGESMADGIMTGFRTANGDTPIAQPAAALRATTPSTEGNAS